MHGPEFEKSLPLRDGIGFLEIEYWEPNPRREATEDVFYIKTQDKAIFDLFNRACKALNDTRVEGLKQPIFFFHQIGPNNDIGETGFELTRENLPPGFFPRIKGLIRQKMCELDSL